MSSSTLHKIITSQEEANNLTSSLKNAKLIVVKVGSSLVTNKGKGIDQQAISHWAQQIAELRALNKHVALVSSGAIAEGMARLGWHKRPKQMNQLQTAAAVGQMGIAQAYESAFMQHKIQTAQILLTHEDLADRHRYLNARSALFTMLELGVLPVINENDTVITDEIRLGDNDTLGALVANLIEADVLVILTDQAGLYDSDPRKNPAAKFIFQAMAGDPLLEQMAGGAGSDIGTGGMLTKVQAAKRAARSGAYTIIASGQEENLLVRLARGEAVGTELRSTMATLSARKQWLADQLHVAGYLTLDAGALQAIVSQGKSLLPIGVTQVQGHFDRGDLVACVDSTGIEYARGLTNYNSSDAAKIMRQPTNKIEKILGMLIDRDIIHRNNMVVTKQLPKITPN